MEGPTGGTTALDNLALRIIQAHNPLHRIKVVVLADVFWCVIQSHPNNTKRKDKCQFTTYRPVMLLLVDFPFLSVFCSEPKGKTITH